jgi:hypothetical protein
LHKAAQAALTLNTTTPLTYNQSETLTVSGGTTGGAVTYNLVSGSCGILVDQLAANSGTGSCTLTATMAGNGNYNAVTSTPANTVNLAKANQAAVTISAPSDATFGSAGGTATAGGGTAGAYSFSDTGSTACTVNSTSGAITVTSGTGSCSLTASRLGNANYEVSSASAPATVTIHKASTTTVPDAKSATYNATDQFVTLAASVVPQPNPNEGTVQFSVSDGVNPIGIVGSTTFSAGKFTAQFTLPGGTSAGSYTIHAQFIGALNYSSSIDATATLLVSPANNLLADVAHTDADFKKIDGFDVLFGKSSISTSYVKLKNTNPGTFHYQLTITNETGLTLHDKNVAISDKNGASVGVLLTVPALPSPAGVAIPSSATSFTGANSAFVTQGAHPVHAHPDDKSDEMPITVLYTLSAPSGNCSAVTLPTIPVPTGYVGPWSVGQPPDNTLVKCLYITGLAIPKHGKARIDVNYQLGPDNTDGWANNAQTAFIAGFAFKSTTTVQVDPGTTLATLLGSATTYTGSQAAGLVGAGSRVTAIGGFVFDGNGNGLLREIRFYTAAQIVGNACAAAPSTLTMSDGFYFAPVADGTKWWVGVCNGGTIEAGQFIDHKLAKKEFDEEDFYVNVP